MFPSPSGKGCLTTLVWFRRVRVVFLTVLLKIRLFRLCQGYDETSRRMPLKEFLRETTFCIFSQHHTAFYILLLLNLCACGNSTCQGVASTLRSCATVEDGLAKTGRGFYYSVDWHPPYIFVTRENLQILRGKDWKLYSERRRFFTANSFYSFLCLSAYG